MLQKVRGIVLKTTMYNESSVIAQIFTDRFGVQSYLINGVKKPKAKIPMNILQPLHLLEMVVYHKPASQMQLVKEARPAPAFKSIPYEVVKNAIVQFLNEVVYKSIKQQHTDEQVFDYIFSAINWFDESNETPVNFHLSFLLKLTKYLGFAPHVKTKSHQKYFDLQEGDFTSAPPIHPNFIGESQAEDFLALYQVSFEKLNEIKLTNINRRYLLDKILVYYGLHTASFGQIKSHQVLEDVLS